MKVFLAVIAANVVVLLMAMAWITSAASVAQTSNLVTAADANYDRAMADLAEAKRRAGQPR